MPYIQTRVMPEQFITHKGVTVFHTYQHDDVEEGPSRYSFTLDPHNDGEDLVSFDVRDLETPNASLLNLHPPYLTLSDPRYADADEATREQWFLDWKAWRDGGERDAIAQIVRSAMDLGLLQAEAVAA